MLLPNDPYSRTERCEVITNTTMNYIYDSLTTTSVSFELVACSLQTEADEQKKMRERNRRHHTPQSAVALQSDQIDVAKKRKCSCQIQQPCAHMFPVDGYTAKSVENLPAPMSKTPVIKRWMTSCGCHANDGKAESH
jgi:hypothetical protein